MVFMPLLILFLLGQGHAASNQTPLSKTVVGRPYKSPRGTLYKKMGDGTYITLNAETIKKNFTPAKLVVEVLQTERSVIEGVKELHKIIKWTTPAPDLYNYQPKDKRSKRRYYSWEHLPKKTSGIYRYVERETNIVVYIGKAKDIKTRTASHLNGKKQYCDKQFMKDPAHKVNDGASRFDDDPDNFESKYFIQYITETDFQNGWKKYLIDRGISEKLAEDRTKNYKYHYMEAWALWVHMNCDMQNAMPAYNKKRDWRPYALINHKRHEEDHHEKMFGGIKVRRHRVYKGDPKELEELKEVVKGSIAEDEPVDVEVEKNDEGGQTQVEIERIQVETGLEDDPEYNGTEMFYEEYALETQLLAKFKLWSSNEALLEKRAAGNHSVANRTDSATRALCFKSPKEPRTKPQPVKAPEPPQWDTVQASITDVTMARTCVFDSDEFKKPKSKAFSAHDRKILHRRKVRRRNDSHPKERKFQNLKKKFGKSNWCRRLNKADRRRERNKRIQAEIHNIIAPTAMEE